MLEATPALTRTDTGSSGGDTSRTVVPVGNERNTFFCRESHENVVGGVPAPTLDLERKSARKAGFCAKESISDSLANLREACSNPGCSPTREC